MATPTAMFTWAATGSAVTSLISGSQDRSAARSANRKQKEMWDYEMARKEMGDKYQYDVAATDRANAWVTNAANLRMNSLGLVARYGESVGPRSYKMTAPPPRPDFSGIPKPR